MIRHPPKSPPFPSPPLSRPHPTAIIDFPPVGAPRCPYISRRSRPASGQTVTVPSSLRRDRKSTRLNSSHLVISYAVFCLKKKSRGPLSGRVDRRRDPPPRRE